MRDNTAVLKQLEALQSRLPIDGDTAEELPAPLSGARLVDHETADTEQLLEAARTADFWISLLEGELADLRCEVAKQRKQGESQASALRASEAERKHLREEVDRLQASRDKAMCEQHLLRATNAESIARADEELKVATERTASLEATLKCERDEKSELERQLVGIKMRYAEALQKVDCTELLVSYYEEQLRRFDPSFEPPDMATISQWMNMGYDLETVSNFSVCTDPVDSDGRRKGKSALHGLSAQMRKMFGSKRSDSRRPSACPDAQHDSEAGAADSSSAAGGGTAESEEEAQKKASSAEKHRLEEANAQRRRVLRRPRRRLLQLPLLPCLRNLAVIARAWRVPVGS
eukprot:gnl/TRDRNA2_/TRDRNA2_85468_c0_seq2.p1 gnl/TRDRNA2_/TRDRNA2_85468_c0~~gnl/TRDRNA2_/TRDRNA2_85468_c0_seq2.p1  ORF type:complete len:363 (+),score=82.14 gnl/TRDRNA2_/TRDRNA2_85468_c0_seq2:46-1089(+)